MADNTKKRIIFFGDSITELGADKGGYIDLMRTFVHQNGLQHELELIGSGISGNKVYDLYFRLEEDVLSKKPHVVVVYIGINDIWHKIKGIGTDIIKFEKFYAAILKKLLAEKIEVFVCTPSVIGEKKDRVNMQDDDLDAYSEIIRRLAAANNCVLVDLRNAFLQFENNNNMENRESGILTTDGVHLNQHGNRLVADAMIISLGIK
jgi:lysophospholipase L1-like esterase